jgi:NAD(P)H-dependent FMN reductase
MSEDQLRLAVIVGSVRTGRFAPVVANWFVPLAESRADFKPDVIDLADFDLPVHLDGGGDTAEYAKRIDVADAFVVVTPEYNHGYPGSLKIAIDTVRDEWKAKPVAFVSYGGAAGGLRAVQQLKTVFTELQAVPVREGVPLAFVHDRFDEYGDLRDGEKMASIAHSMLDQLAWWGSALRRARGNGRP